jgi:hypothetical protein
MQEPCSSKQPATSGFRGVPFEQDTSPLYRSNDGRLLISPERSTTPPGFVVIDTADSHVALFTLTRELVDAFIAGYDLATKATR